MRSPVWSVALACAVWTSGCGDSSTPSVQNAILPGIYSTAPPGIHEVRGECRGRIALTPGKPHATTDGHPYPLVYDCASRTFAVLNGRSGLRAMADLTLTPDGYYVFQTDGHRAGYDAYDPAGRHIRALPRPNAPKVHDLIIREGEVMYIKYVPDWNAARCVRAAPLELEIVSENAEGERLWSWSSKGRFDVSHKTATRESMTLAGSPRSRPLASFRHCFTTLARKLVDFEPPRWFLAPDKFPLLLMQEDDYIHANSIQWLEPSGDILLSAPFLDAVFIIDRASGDVKWSLGGPHAKATSNRPVDEARGGFSHQEYARISGNTLWVLDNGNLFPHLPSRAVGYRLDTTGPPGRVFEFHEPNGRLRPALGSVQALRGGELLIGWGTLRPADFEKPQRAASIVRLSDGREVFSIDLAPGWISYRVKALQP
jgi:hypothetical protein